MEPGPKTGAEKDGGMFWNLLGEMVERGRFHWFGWETWPRMPSVCRSNQINCVFNGS